MSKIIEDEIKRTEKRIRAKCGAIRSAEGNPSVEKDLPFSVSGDNCKNRGTYHTYIKNGNGDELIVYACHHHRERLKKLLE